MATALTPDDQLEFDLGEGEKAVKVELPGDEEAGQQAPAAEAAPQKPQVQEDQEHRDEINAVGQDVQKRIAKLTAKMREAERREQAALEYAKGLQKQAQELQQKLVHTDYSRLNEAKGRLETQQAQLKAIIRKAREEGDLETETEAIQRLTDLGSEYREVAGSLQQQEARREQSFQQETTPQAPQQRQPAVQQAAQPNPRAEQWAAENEWFGKDKTMTYAAWGIHQTLIDDEGFDPNSEEYYTELDRRLRDEFPKRFSSQSAPEQFRQQRSAPAVAPANRSSGINSARRTVRLSPSQVAIAKKLGVPLEEYAKYVKE